MSTTGFMVVAFFLIFMGNILMMLLENHEGWVLPVILPLALCLIGVSIFFTPPFQVKLEAERLAAEKQQQEIEARNNRCIDDLSKRYNLSPETIKFLMDNGKIPCPPVN